MVAAAFGSMFTVFAVVYSFGAFFDSMAREFHAGRAATSAVFSITVFLYFTLGSLTGLLADRLGPRRVVAAGALAMAAGLVLTSLAPSIWLGYLTYGVGVGIGVACGYVPMVAAVGGWFTRGRSLALGLAISGIGFGTLVGAPVAAALIKSLGWRQTLVLQAAAALILLAVCAALAERPPHSATSDLRVGAALRTRRFAAMYVNGVMAGFALFIAFAHLTPFAIHRGTDPVAAAALVGVIGAGSAVGRLALSGIAEPLGPVLAFQATALLFAASFAVWLLAPSYPWLVVFAAALGVGYGGWVALAPSVVAELFGTERMGGTIGALYTGPGLGALVGAPLAGFMVDRTGSYTPAIATALVLAAVGFLPVLGLRVSSSHGDRQPG